MPKIDAGSYEKKIALVDLQRLYQKNPACDEIIDLIQKVDINAPIIEGLTPLHVAVKMNLVEVARDFIIKSADQSATCDSGETPLELAFQYGFSEMIQLFFTSRDINAIVNPQTGDTFLHLVAQYGNIEFVEQCLSKGADPSPLNVGGNTPLHLALEFSHVGIAQNLLQHGANKYTTANSRGVTPLKLAIKIHDSALINLLFNENEVQTINDPVCPETQNTLLHLAAQYGNIEFVEECLKQGADPSPLNSAKNTPLHLALEFSNVAIAQSLLKYEANKSIANDRGVTPLELAIKIHNSVLINRLFFFNEETRPIDSIVNSYTRNTRLHIAAEHGNIQVVQQCLRQGADPSPLNSAKNTPLHLALNTIKNRDTSSILVDTVKCLFDKGANLEIKNNQNHCPLYLALLTSNFDIIGYFLNSCERPLDRSEPDRSERRNKILTLSLSCGDKKAVQFILDQITNTTDGSTYLHKAVLANNIDAVKCFIRDESPHCKNEQNKTPLDLAIQCKYANIVDLLLKREVGSSTQLNSLDIAIQMDHIDAVRFLIETPPDADVSAFNKQGDRPCHTEVVNRRSDIFQFHLDKGAQISISYEMGKTPLDLAIEYRAIGIVHTILNRMGNGSHPLNIAVKIGHKAAVRFLLDDINPQNPGKEELVELALEQDNFDILKLILDHEKEEQEDTSIPLHCFIRRGYVRAAKRLIEDINTRIYSDNNQRKTALDLAIEYKQIEIVKLFLSSSAYPLHDAIEQGHTAAVKCLIESDAGIISLKRDEDTPLHTAVKKDDCDLQMIEFLVNQGASIFSINAMGDTPLHIAVQKYRLDIIELLLNKGANISAINPLGNTPLHIAVEKNSHEIIKFLFERRAEMFVLNKEGKTPLDLAIDKEDIPTIIVTLNCIRDRKIGDKHDGSYYLHVATEFAYTSAIPLLLKDENCDINHADRYGMTPLMYASKKNDDTAVNCLYEHKAEVNKKNNKTGWTALDYAVAAGNDKIVLFLRDKGAKSSVVTNDADRLLYLPGTDIVCRELNTAGIGFFDSKTNRQDRQVQGGQQNSQSSSSSSQYSPSS